MIDNRTQREKQTDNKIAILERAIAVLTKKTHEQAKRIKALEERPAQVVRYRSDCLA